MAASSASVNSKQPVSSNITQPMYDDPITPAPMTYPCHVCPRTFSHPMGVVAHQKSHKDAGKASKRQKTLRNKPISMTRSGPSMVNPFSAQFTTKRPGTIVGPPSSGIISRYEGETEAKRRRENTRAMMSALPLFPSATPNPLASAPLLPIPSAQPYPTPPASLVTLPFPAYVNPTPRASWIPLRVNTPPPASLQQAPSANTRNTKFFGVHDLFGQSVVSAAPLGAGASRPSVVPTTPLGDGASSGPSTADNSKEDQGRKLKI